MEENMPELAKKWLEDLGEGRSGYEIETIHTRGLRFSLAQKGLMRASFVVPEALGDKDGNWHTGSIAILIDNFGAATIISSGVIVKSSVAIDISYLSAVKIQEEVEIEAKVLNHKGNLCAVVVEITRKQDEELVSSGKQWMNFLDITGQRSSKL